MELNAYPVKAYYDQEDSRIVSAGNTQTQTIDLQGLFTSQLGSAAAFDLSDIGSTSLGKLLEALPLPVLLIDQWFCIAYVNHAGEKLGLSSKLKRGSRFIDLLPSRDDEVSANSLKAQTLNLLEVVFAERKPVRAEAILGSGNHRLWVRLHLRSIRLSSAIHIMAIMEDVTSERTCRRMFQKEDKQLRRLVVDGQKRLELVARELSETKQELIHMTNLYKEATCRLNACPVSRSRDKDWN